MRVHSISGTYFSCKCACDAYFVNRVALHKIINKDGMVTAGAYERTMTAKEKDNVSSHSLRSFVSSRGSLLLGEE